MTSTTPSEYGPLSILYRDASIIAVSKPSGLVVHRGWGRDDVVLAGLIRELVGHPVYLIHRLDRGTSGVVVFALSSEVAATLGEQFMRHQTVKRYVALVFGTPPALMQSQRPLTKRGKGPARPACTHFRRLYAMEFTSVVEAVPVTGRTHQIRRHLYHLGHHIIGDNKHGYKGHNRVNQRLFDLDRLALHAWSLSFIHPVTGASMTIEAPLPEDLMVPFRRMAIPDALWERLCMPANEWWSTLPVFKGGQEEEEEGEEKQEGAL